MRDQATPVTEPTARPVKRDPTPFGPRSRPGRALPGSVGGMLDLQRSAGNQAVARLAGGPLAGRVAPGAPGAQVTPGSTIGPAAPGTDAVLQRLALTEGPPLAPGNYRYGSQLVCLDQKGLQQLLSEKAGNEGLKAERTWQQAFVADMRAQSGHPRSYEDPASKQTISVEPMLATRADYVQQQLETQATATQTQFQQQLLNSVRGLLDSSDKKLEAEGRRYGFPDTESIFQPKPVSAGQAAITPSMPGSDDLRGVMVGAKELLDGKRAVKKARDMVAKSGPILGDAMRPGTLEPALRDYHALRQRVCTKYPILASVERNEDRLAELAGGAAAGGSASGQASSSALLKAKEEVRKELADKMGNIAYVRDGMKEQDKIDRFWLDPALRANTKRSLSIAPSSFNNAAVEEKAERLQADAEFEQKLKQAIGVGLLIASFVPGLGLVAGGVGLVMGGLDVAAAFQQYYWEEAAAGSAMEKADAISQTEPSLFGLAMSIAVGLLEGVAEAKALEGAIGVFKVVSAAYREARAAAVAAKIGSGAAKATGAAEMLAASEKLRTTADQAAGKPGLGDKILADLPVDVRSAAMSLDQSLKIIKDPALKELIKKGDRAITSNGETLMDLAIADPHGLEADFTEWKKNNRSGSSGKSFEDWIRDVKQKHAHGLLNNPAGVVEYGLDAGGARRSFEACLREDPSREAGVWRDPATGEHVCVQGGAGFVESAWMADSDALWGARPKWELVVHHHPNRGLAIDRLPSPSDFAVITSHQRAGAPARPISSTITWFDPVSKIRFETEFGFTPGAQRPFWAKYRVEDGSSRIATFKDPPFGAGNAEYQQFINTFGARPTDPVPGGNLPPVTAPPRTP